ncbi:MAG: hypothetical protein JO323_07115 [Acidobacteriia bacterium]|nr:hypothetical protein [Terriglobia bacterium]
MSKRPPIDLISLTTEQAVPMPEATQRVAPMAAPKTKPQPVAVVHDETKTENLEALAFKVPPSFRKRFRQRAVEADLKLNELLFEALDAWEEKKRKK